MNGASMMNPCVFRFKFYLTSSEIISCHLMPQVLYNFVSETFKSPNDSIDRQSPYKEIALASEKAGVLAVSLVLENINIDELKGILPFFKNSRTIKFIPPSPNTFKNVNLTDDYFQALSESGILNKLMGFEVDDALNISIGCVNSLEKCFDVCLKETVVGDHKERSIVARRKIILTQEKDTNLTY